jgi:hypothetical protein
VNFEKIWRFPAFDSMIDNADSMLWNESQAMKPVERPDRMPVAGRRVPLGRGARRLGEAMLDYVLVLGAVLPMLGMSYYYSMKIIRAVYEMTCTLVCWPFM